MSDVNIYSPDNRGSMGRRRNAKVTRRYRETIQTGQAEAPASARSPAPRPNTRPTATSGPGSYRRALGASGTGLYTNLRAQRMDAESRRSS